MFIPQSYTTLNYSSRVGIMITVDDMYKVMAIKRLTNVLHYMKRDEEHKISVHDQKEYIPLYTKQNVQNE